MDKLKNQLQVSVSNGFTDEGDGVVSFPNGLTITDGSVMRSGTRYDVGSLNINDYQGQLTADHHDSLGTLIGKVTGVAKEGGRVVISGIKYAVKENPYARLAYDLLVGGFSDSFSIETTGPYPDEGDRTYRNHELVGLSQVVVPNNYNAKINQFNEIVHNSLERSQQDGLDIAGVEEKIYSSVELKSSEAVEEESMKPEEVNTSEVDTPVAEPEKVEAETVEEVTKTDNETVVVEDEVKEETEVKEESEAPAVEESETEVKNEADTEVEAPKTSEPAEEVVEETETEAVVPEVKEELEEVVEDESTEDAEKQTNQNEEKIEMTAEQIAEIVKASLAEALKPVTDELASTKELAQNAFDAQAKEPEFEKEAEVEKNAYDSMSASELFAKQLNAAVAAERSGSVEGRKILNEINARNLQALKDEKIVNHALTLEDLGNFVIAPELFRDIANARTDYTSILNATQWRETDSLEFGWLTRTSDIDMQNVAIGALGDVPSPDTTNNRLKPVSMPGYGAHTDKLEEMAAVTPISINVIKFAAADILADVAEGYRNDYDKKRAQLVIARLQQAVDQTGAIQNFNISDGLIGWTQVVSKISDATTVGTLVFNNRTLSALKGQAIASQNAAVLTEIAGGAILGTPFIVVPNDLMPTLNTTETRTFNVQGSPVVVDTAVFYGDLRTFTGRTSGGLQYDVDGSASYEIDGVTYSAYQRNEIVLRGSFLRGGVVKDVSVIAGIPAVAVS